MVDLEKQIHNIPTGDKEMADDPRYPVMDVSMVKIDRQGEIILHGPGGPAPLASLDETARFEVMRRTINDMMEQNLDLPVGIVLLIVVVGREIAGRRMLQNLAKRLRKKAA